MDKDINDLSSKKKRNLISSLDNYIRRAATRTTPFGLMAGIDILSIDDKPTAIQKDLIYQKHSRVDAEWLFSFVKNIELKHIEKLYFKINSVAYTLGDRLCIPYDLSNQNAEINVSFSNPLKMIKEFCNSDFVSYDELLNMLRKEFPNREEQIFSNYLKTLVEKDILMSDLRPPLVNSDLLTYLMDKAKNVEALSMLYTEKLEEIQKMLHLYNQTKIGEGLSLYKEIESILKKLHPTKGNKYIEVDTSITIDTNIISEKSVETINECLSLCLYFSTMMEKHGDSKKEFKDFFYKFIDKFGTNVEVPIFMAIDELIGVGAPYNYKKPKNKYVRNMIKETSTGNNPLKSFFLNKYILALQNRSSIDISEDDFPNIEQVISDKGIPKSLEINFTLRQDFNNDLLLYLGSNVGSSKAGKTFGRFCHFHDKCQDTIKEIQKQEKENFRDSVELSFLSGHTRSANVTQVSSYYKKNLSLFTSSYNPDEEIKIENILIGCSNEGLYLKDKASKRILDITTTNMLNLTQVSNLIRIVSEISRYQELEWMIFPWDIYYENFTYIPEIKYKNIILSNEKWSLQELKILYQEQKIKNFDDFDIELIKFISKFSVPNEVYSKFADNKIPIDLNRKEDRELLYKNLKKYPMVIIERVEDGKSPLIINKSEYSAEVTLPFLSNYQQVDTNANISGTVIKFQHHLPFEEWLFIKFYGDVDRQDELLAHIEFLLAEKIHLDFSAKELFYYIRYNDPNPHIRLRIKSDIKKRLFEIYDSIMDYCEKLEVMNIVTSVTIDTYIPEVNRYGGEELQKHAEQIFLADSIMNLQINNNMKKIGISKEVWGVVSLLKFLEDMNLSFEEQLNFLELNVQDIEKDKVYFSEFKESELDYVTVVDSFDEWKKFLEDPNRKKLLSYFNVRSTSISEYFKKYNQVKTTTNEIFNITGSFIHMSFNRMFPMDRDFEEKIYSYAYHTLYGQRTKRKFVLAKGEGL